MLLEKLLSHPDNPETCQHDAGKRHKTVWNGVHYGTVSTQYHLRELHTQQTNTPMHVNHAPFAPNTVSEHPRDRRRINRFKVQIFMYNSNSYQSAARIFLGMRELA